MSREDCYIKELASASNHLQQLLKVAAQDTFLETRIKEDIVYSLVKIRSEINDTIKMLQAYEVHHDY